MARNFVDLNLRTCHANLSGGRVTQTKKIITTDRTGVKCQVRVAKLDPRFELGIKVWSFRSSGKKQ